MKEGGRNRGVNFIMAAMYTIAKHFQHYSIHAHHLNTRFTNHFTIIFPFPSLLYPLPLPRRSLPLPLPVFLPLPSSPPPSPSIPNGLWRVPMQSNIGYDLTYVDTLIIYTAVYGTEHLRGGGRGEGGGRGRREGGNSNC